MSSVDVVIVAFRSDAHMASCVRSVLDDDAVATITVVDHGDGGSASVAAALTSRVRTAWNPSNPGFGAGQNAGASTGTAEAILVLNPDAELAEGALAHGLRTLAADPSVAMVQGVISNAETGELDRSQGRELGVVDLYGRALGLRRLLVFRVVRRVAARLPAVRDHLHRQPLVARAVDSLAATAPLVRRGAFEAVGGFDESYFLYGEDLDLCRRLRRAGWTLMALPMPWATHLSGSSSASFVDRELAWWSGTLRFAATWWSPRAFAAALPAACFMALRLCLRNPRRSGAALHLMGGAIGHRRQSRRSAARRSRASAAAISSTTPSSRGRC